MNEIEKMYENASVKYYKEICVIKNEIDNLSSKECYFEICCTSCPLCKSSFTTNKQILLIQWLLDKTDLYLHRNKSDFTYSIATGDIAVNKYKDFRESIAELINAIWQSLTEEEKQQVKEILE